MSNPAVVYTGNSLSVYYEGDTKVFPSDHPDFTTLVSLYKAKKFTEMVDYLYATKAKIEALSQDFHVRDGLVFVTRNNKEESLPTQLGERLVQFAEEGIDYQYLLRFWDKLRLNPSFRSVQGLFKFLEKHHVPICENGDFICWKGVTNNFRDHHTKTFDNSVGKTVEIPRNQVDDNPANECSYGLHVAAHAYAQGFGNEKLVEVRVNPADVVAVPADYDFQKMRVTKYVVVKEVPLKSAARTDTVVGRDDYDDSWGDDDYYDSDDDYDDDYDDDVDW